MMRLVAVLSLLALGLSTVACLDTSLDAEWLQWNLDFQKPIRRAVDTRTREIWEDNYKFIKDHNERFRQGQETFEMALNTFADMNEVEFAAFTQSSLPETMTRSFAQLLSVQKLREAASILNMSSIDYRHMGYISPVAYQGRCGSCWAFSATGALEAQYMKRTGVLVKLSDQQLMDCSYNSGNRGCRGGFPHRAYNYIITNGIQAQDSYPYTATQGTCAANPDLNVVTMRKWSYLPKGDEQALEDALVTMGPVAVTMNASSRRFQFYRGGVFDDPYCSRSRNHAVLLVGFGVDDGAKYWTIKNSWGTRWGEQGYIRLAKNKQCQCGIGMYGVIPSI